MTKNRSEIYREITGVVSGRDMKKVYALMQLKFKTTKFDRLDIRQLEQLQTELDSAIQKGNL